MGISKTILENLTFKERWEYLTQDANREKLRKFQLFHEANRKVYSTMEEFAEKAWKSGTTKMSHWMLLNRVRWEFKVNNDYFAFYARLLIAKQPKFADLITIKELKR